jgi:hypothetical protein
MGKSVNFKPKEVIRMKCPGTDMKFWKPIEVFNRVGNLRPAF